MTQNVRREHPHKIFVVMKRRDSTSNRVPACRKIMTSAFEGDLTIKVLVLSALNRGTAAQACYQSYRASGHCASEKYLLNVCSYAILS